MTERIKWIDSLKGFTIVLVVIGHTIGGYISSHMLEVDYRAYQFIFDLIYSFHMPLAMLLSGYVFNIAYSGSKFENKKKKVIAHALDFYILYLLSSIVMAMIKLMNAGAVNSAVSIRDLIWIPIKPIEGTGLWYLFLLAEFYVLSFPYKKIGNNIATKSIIELVVLFAISCLMTCIPTIRYFEISRIMEYGFFFMLGNKLTKTDANGKHSVCLLIVGFALSIISIATDYRNSFLGRIISILICVGLVMTFKCIKCDGMLGTYMMEIYILHLFIVPTLRLVLIRLLPNYLLLNIVLVSFAGILLPVLFGIFTRKVKINSLIFSPISCFLKRRNQI